MAEKMTARGQRIRTEKDKAETDWVKHFDEIAFSMGFKREVVIAPAMPPFAFQQDRIFKYLGHTQTEEW